MKIEFELACQSCYRKQVISIQAGDPWPLLRCSFCEHRLDIKNWTGGASPPARLYRSRRKIGSPQPKEENGGQISGNDNSLVYHHESDGWKPPLTISPFVNRLYLPLQVLITLNYNDSGMNVSELYRELVGVARKSRAYFIQKEIEDGVMRGERLSDGIPLDESREPPIFTPIAHRNLLGFSEHSKKIGNAIPFVMKWIKMDQENGLINLTEAGRKLAVALNESSTKLELVTKTNAYIHSYLPYDTTEHLMAEIVEKTPGEAEIMLMLLEAALEGPYTTSGFAKTIYNSENPIAIRWWNDATGRNRAIKELEIAARRKKRKRAEPEKKFVNSLNARLGGTQQRMKELGLVLPFKSGLSKGLRSSKYTEKAAQYLREAGVRWPQGHEELWGLHMKSINHSYQN